MRALKHRGPIGDAMQLTFRKHLRRCVELLTQDSTPTLNDAAVHEIRIKIKKARALLQLARAALSQRRYERVKRKLRTTSHCLGGLRDATVRLDTSKRLMRPANPAKRAALLLKLNRQLQAARRRLTPSLRRAMAHDLVSAQKKFAGWSGSDAGWRVVGSGLRQAYARARDAFDSARLRPGNARLHGLRKRSKRLLYMCEFLGSLSPYAHSKAQQLRRLSAFLGTVHDLSLLQHATAPMLQQKALRLGAGIYHDSPQTFLKRVRKEGKKV